MDEELFCMLSMEQSHFSLADGAEEREHSPQRKDSWGRDSMRSAWTGLPSFPLLISRWLSEYSVT